VVLNGNIKSPEDVKFVFDNYEPDAVMIGQGAISNPWIFNQSKSLIKSGSYSEPSIEERIDVCIEHLKLSCALKGEKFGSMEFRKHYSGYLRDLPGISKFRLELMTYLELEPIVNKLLKFKEVCKLALESN
jgi:tRNA-dihydrouridine synthase B